MILITLSVILHVFVTYLFIIKYNYNIIGTSFSCFITNSLLMMSLYIYTNWFSDYEIEKALVAPDMRSVDQGLIEYLSIGCQNIFMISLECWAQEVSTLIAGRIGVTV